MAKEILVVGVGSIGERHVRCFGQLPGITVSACEINEGLLARIKEKYRLRQTFTDWNSIPLEQFYAVVICTPANLHVPMIRRALEHSCHVLCEKPLAVDLAGVEEMIEFAESSDRVTAVAYVWRCNAALHAFKAIVDSGTLGQIQQMAACWGQEFPRYRPAYADIYYKDHKTGGGALQDAVTHIVNFLEWILGPTSEVFCLADHLVLPKVQVEDTASLTLKFKDRPMIGTLTLNQFQKHDEGTVQFAGTKTSARFDYTKWTVEVFDVEQRIWQGKSYPIYERDEMYITQAQAFLDGVEKGVPRPCSLRDAFGTLKTIQAAFRSWQTGRMVRVDDGG